MLPVGRDAQAEYASFAVIVVVVVAAAAVSLVVGATHPLESGEASDCHSVVRDWPFSGCSTRSELTLMTMCWFFQNGYHGNIFHDFSALAQFRQAP